MQIRHTRGCPVESRRHDDVLAFAGSVPKRSCKEQLQLHVGILCRALLNAILKGCLWSEVGASDARRAAPVGAEVSVQQQPELAGE